LDSRLVAGARGWFQGYNAWAVANDSYATALREGSSAE
jgi:hypothetical protein